MNPRLIPTDLLAVLAGGSTIMAWQEQVEWTLKIVATIIAIAAGVASLLYHRRDRRRHKPRPRQDSW